MGGAGGRGGGWSNSLPRLKACNSSSPNKRSPIRPKINQLPRFYKIVCIAMGHDHDHAPKKAGDAPAAEDAKSGSKPLPSGAAAAAPLVAAAGGLKQE